MVSWVWDFVWDVGVAWFGLTVFCGVFGVVVVFGFVDSFGLFGFFGFG